MKIALGTVQWGMKYGIFNKSVVPDDKSLKKILSIASSAGIRLLDTASSYGKAEFRLGQLSTNNFKIITKINTGLSNKSIYDQIGDSLLRLKQKKLYGVLFHNPNDLIENKNLWKELYKNKLNGRVKKIGYSLYEPQQLDQLIKLNLIPDLIQLPLNVLDRKFLSYLPFLKKKNIEIHVRSVFLQGLFFRESYNLPKKLKPLESIIKYLKYLSKKYDMSILNICLGYILQMELIDYCIVGIDNQYQLNEILNLNNIYPKELTHDIENIIVKEKDLLNPINWLEK